MKIVIDKEKTTPGRPVYRRATDTDRYPMDINSAEGTFERNYAGEEIIQSTVQASYFYYIKIYSVTEKEWINHIEYSYYMSDAVKKEMIETGAYEAARRKSNLIYAVGVSMDMTDASLENERLDAMRKALDNALMVELAYALDEAIAERGY